MEITEQRLIDGVMRELFLWSRVIAIDGENYLFESIEEPEEAFDAGRRALVLQGRPVPSDRAMCQSEHFEGHVSWRAHIETSEGRPLVFFPDKLILEENGLCPSMGQQVLSLFCRAGAITGQYIGANHRHLLEMMEAVNFPWENALVERFIEKSEECISGHLAAVRFLDNVWLVGDVARYVRSRNGRDKDIAPSGQRFIGTSLTSLADRIGKVSDEPMFAICWRRGLKYWDMFETYLRGAGSEYLVKLFDTLYTRASARSERSFSESITLLPIDDDGPIPNRLDNEIKSLLGIFQFDLCTSPLLGSALAAHGMQLSRQWLKLVMHQQAVGLAMVSGLPTSWNVRKTCNCTWVFPFFEWDMELRRAIYHALDNLVEASPGILEVGNPANGATGTRWLRWCLFKKEGLNFFERWANDGA